MNGKNMLLTVAIFMCLLCMAVATKGNKRREAEAAAEVAETKEPPAGEKKGVEAKKEKGSKPIVLTGTASEMPSSKIPTEITRSEDEAALNNILAQLSPKKIDQKKVDKKARDDQFRMKQMYAEKHIEKKVAAESKQEELRKKHAEKHSEHAGKSAVDAEEPAETIVNELPEGHEENDVEQTLDVEVPEVHPTVKHDLKAEEHPPKRKGKASVSTVDEQVMLPKKQNAKKRGNKRPALGGTKSRKADYTFGEYDGYESDY